MLTHFSSNVILSKTRAMYGKRLMYRDYSELLSCKSVNEVAVFLKSKTNYNKHLLNINENDAHRGILEVLLKQKFFFDCALLFRYELSTGQHFSEYLIESFEIEQIMHSLMFLSSGNHCYSMSMFFNKHTRIDLVALSKVKEYNDILRATARSKYKAILEPFKPNQGDKIDLPTIENMLYSDLYGKLFNIIEKYSKGKEKEELLNMMKICVDIKNFVRILRLKKYYKVDNNYIRNSLFKFGTLKQKNINQMIESIDTNEIISIMRTTIAGRKVGKIDFTYIDEIYEKVRFKLSRKNIRFSVNSAVVMFSYIFLLEIEISNIINIIEGIRYRVPSSEIDKMLVYGRE